MTFFFDRFFEKLLLWMRTVFAGLTGSKPSVPPTPCDCSSCGPNPSFTCSYSGEDETVDDAYIANAYRGNLLLCPGSGAGVIGGLLHALTPPQHYSHMGILVANYNLVRHCTCSSEWLTASEYFTGSVLGVPAPVDGLDPSHLQFGWPGTITQSVYQAVMAERYGTNPPPGSAAAYAGSMLTDQASTQTPKSKYLMADLSFDPVSDDGQTWYPPLIVKPCPSLQTSAVTNALGRIADAALEIYAHYRFYCYTNGLVGGILDYSGPGLSVPVAQPDFNLAEGRWTDWAEPATQWITPGSTIPGVCSSFVWQAVQQAFPKNLATVVLDWAKDNASGLGEDNGACVRTIPPDWTADTLDPYTVDGLYYYSEDGRKTAGQVLHDNLSQQVFDSLKQSLHKSGGVEKAVGDAIDDVGRGAFIAAAEGGVAALSALLLPMLAGVVLDSVFLENLIELLYDMPEDLANQVCNAFAFDCYRGFPGDTSCVDALGNEITDVDSSNWASAPGPGRAVSPDNIHMFWDAPGPSDQQTIRGLYGYNVTAKLCLGLFSRPMCVLVPSTGTATISGFVMYKDQVLAGAYVTAGCATTVTPGPNSPYQMTVKSGGQYKLVARYEDPKTGLIFYGEAVTGAATDPPIAPKAQVWVNISVIEPPACMRNIVVQGIIRCDDVYLTGSDSDQQSFQKTLYVQSGVPYFDISTGTWTVTPDLLGRHLSDNATASFAQGDSNGQLNMSATVITDGSAPENSVQVMLQGVLNPGDDNMSTNPITFTVQPDQTVTVSDSELDTGGPFNDRAYFRGITVVNQASTAI